MNRTWDIATTIAMTRFTGVFLSRNGLRGRSPPSRPLILIYFTAIVMDSRTHQNLEMTSISEVSLN